MDLFQDLLLVVRHAWPPSLALRGVVSRLGSLGVVPGRSAPAMTIVVVVCVISCAIPVRPLPVAIGTFTPVISAVLLAPAIGGFVSVRGGLTKC